MDYYVYYIVDGVNQDPAALDSSPVFGRVGIPVPIASDDADTVVATKTRDRIVADLGVPVGEVTIPAPTTASFTITNLTTTQIKRSLLYEVFGGITFDQLNYFDHMRLLLENTFGKQSRTIKVRLGWNSEHEDFPVISILLPDEESNPKQVGVTQGVGINTGLNQVHDVVESNFQTTYLLAITSNNQNDVIMLYHWLKTALLQAQQTFIGCGLQNLWISGRDLTHEFQLAPMSTYHRSVGMTFHYDNSVPSINKREGITSILYTGTVSPAPQNP